jgi:hypothetical protein
MRRNASTTPAITSSGSQRARRRGTSAIVSSKSDGSAPPTVRVVSVRVELMRSGTVAEHAGASGFQGSRGRERPSATGLNATRPPRRPATER